MARPKKCRRVCAEPRVRRFLPEDGGGEQVTMTVDELECIRLLDWEGLTQEECAAQMMVARATITSIYDAARRKVADALVHGKGLAIQGGDFAVCPHGSHCCGRCGGGGRHCQGQCDQRRNCSHSKSQDFSGGNEHENRGNL